MTAQFYTTMPFGRYRGRRIDEVPEDYLRWVLANCNNITPRLRSDISSFLARAPKSPEPNALSVPAVADQWYRRLAMEFHPDRGGHHEAMKAVNRGRDLLLELVGGSR